MRHCWGAQVARTCSGTGPSISPSSIRPRVIAPEPSGVAVKVKLAGYTRRDGDHNVGIAGFAEPERRLARSKEIRGTWRAAESIVSRNLGRPTRRKWRFCRGFTLCICRFGKWVPKPLISISHRVYDVETINVIICT